LQRLGLRDKGSNPAVNVPKPSGAARLHKAIDFVVCLGGDGVLLHASSLFRRAIPPVISFNLGSLGFLTNHTFDDYQRDLRDVITGGEDLVECSLPGEMMRVRADGRGICFAAYAGLKPGMSRASD